MARPSGAFFATCLALVVLICFSHPASAQEFGRIEETQSSVAYFFHARPGQATIQVSVWGSVPKSGIYEVPVGTELDRLLTMAGGAPLPPRSDRQERDITVRLFRVQDGVREEIYKAPIESMIQNPESYPTIQDDDIMIIETVTDQKFTFREALSIVSTLGTLTLLGLRLFDRRR